MDRLEGFFVEYKEFIEEWYTFKCKVLLND
jgi:hypothetical protein